MGASLSANADRVTAAASRSICGVLGVPERPREGPHLRPRRLQYMALHHALQRAATPAADWLCRLLTSDTLGNGPQRPRRSRRAVYRYIDAPRPGHVPLRLTQASSNSLTLLGILLPKAYVLTQHGKRKHCRPEDGRRQQCLPQPCQRLCRKPVLPPP
jgi:hypothetical protein